MAYDSDHVVDTEQNGDFASNASMTPALGRVRLSEIVFDEVIYPRKDHDPTLVQRYAAVIEEIEAAHHYISISADKKLIDGKHRWLGYRKHYEGQDVEIPVLIYPVTTAHDQLRLAVRLNSEHGWQLTEVDKERNAKALHAYGMSYKTIGDALSVGQDQVGTWLARIVKDKKDSQATKAFDLWLSCYTQAEIAMAIGVSQKAVSNFSNSLLAEQNTKTVGSGEGDDSDDDAEETGLTSRAKRFAKKATSPAALHQTDFDIPLYNVWKQQTKTAGSSHFGNSEVRWVDNLLYLYTKPFDVVADPFAGGGSTIDICKKRFRRYFVSDRKPIVERENEIRQHDLTDGLPKAPWKDVKLVYLDPPYWLQAAGQYSDDPTDLANMPLNDFNKALGSIINGYAAKLSPGAVIAMIIQPTQWKAPDRQYTDHILDMAELASSNRLRVDLRISVPYESQQCNAQMVMWAKENKKVLVLSREIIVWRVV